MFLIVREKLLLPWMNWKQIAEQMPSYDSSSSNF